LIRDGILNVAIHDDQTLPELAARITPEDRPKQRPGLVLEWAGRQTKE
jgi:hypothetical protein